jgi:hypothetical protein
MRVCRGYRRRSELRRALIASSDQLYKSGGKPPHSQRSCLPSIFGELRLVAHSQTDAAALARFAKMPPVLVCF